MTKRVWEIEGKTKREQEEVREKEESRLCGTNQFEIAWKKTKRKKEIEIGRGKLLWTVKIPIFLLPKPSLSLWKTISLCLSSLSLSKLWGPTWITSPRNRHSEFVGPHTCPLRRWVLQSVTYTHKERERERRERGKHSEFWEENKTKSVSYFIVIHGNVSHVT